MPKPSVVNITIDGKKFMIPDPVRCQPGRALVFVIHNEDGDAYDVTIDPTTIVEKQDPGVRANPTTVLASLTQGVPGMNSRTMRFPLKAKAKFGKGAGLLPYTTYKYTVLATIVSTGVAIPDLDPDLDITP